MLEHNLRTLNDLEFYTSRGMNCCVVNPCGSGKSSVMAEFIKKNCDKEVVLFTKQKNARNYYENLDCAFKKVKIRTYSKMLRDCQKKRFEDYRADIYILDEAHYIGADKWNLAFNILNTAFRPIIVGFTATPQRYEDQGTDNTIVDQYFNGCSAGNFSSKELQETGVFVEPEYVLSLWDLSENIESKLIDIEESELSERQKDRYRQQLRAVLSAWEKNSCPQKVLAEYLPRFMYKKKCNRILVYMSSVEEIDKRRAEVDELIKNAVPCSDYISESYTYRDGEGSFERFLREDEHYIKVLYSVNKVMETVHIDDLNIILMLRPSVSNRIITQQFGRANSIGNHKQPLIVDMVGNLDRLGSVNFLGEGKTMAKSQNVIRPRINIKHLAGYKSVFDSLDRVLGINYTYTYKGIKGTLRQLCHIYNKDLKDAQNLIAKGEDIEDALNAARSCGNTYISQEIFEGVRDIPDFNIPDEARGLINKHMSTVDRYIKRRSIEDDDLIQELYLIMMKCVSENCCTATPSIRLSQRILTCMQQHYNRYLRAKVARARLYEENSFENIKMVSGDDFVNNIMIDEYMQGVLPAAFASLNSNEKKVLSLRFGFNEKEPETLEEIGKELNVTRERIRQIEAKGLRKLRHPSRCKGHEGIECLHMLDNR